jgi:hypothetical protein
MKYFCPALFFCRVTGDQLCMNYCHLDMMFLTIPGSKGLLQNFMWISILILKLIFEKQNFIFRKTFSLEGHQRIELKDFSMGSKSCSLMSLKKLA